MSKALETMLAGILDYAGMFPPAKLPLEKAFANYVTYTRCADRWMLGGFVVPVARLAQLVWRHLTPLDELSLCLIGGGGNHEQEFINEFEADLEEIERFYDRREICEWTYETKLPPHSSLRNGYVSLLEQMANHLKASHVRFHRIHLESPNATMKTVADLVVAVSSTDLGCKLGVKLRCGGLKPSDVPSTDFVAQVLSFCSDTPLKFTAGLHHPLPRYDDEIGARMHGFINVFVAGILNKKYRLSREKIVAILDDTKPDDFRFDDDSFSWRDYSATIDDIKTTGANFPGFGSCSFDEPREDLKVLGWM